MGLNSYHLTLYPISGQTPLEEEEREGLIIKNISTQGELDEFEQQNIESALLWLKRKKLTSSQLLSLEFVKKLHQKMFENVWLWAGKFRVSDKNLGVNKNIITIEVQKLLDDCSYWLDNKTFNNDEIAVRLKHRLVSIHPFCNGNGRHSRLMADLLLEKVLQVSAFSWSSRRSQNNNLRRQYLAALRKADQGNYKDLINFARS